MPNLDIRSRSLSQTWWYVPVILALRRLGQEVHEFEASLNYVARLGLKKEKRKSMSFISHRYLSVLNKDN
jgi:hypothetical protein